MSQKSNLIVETEKFKPGRRIEDAMKCKERRLIIYDFNFTETAVGFEFNYCK